MENQIDYGKAKVDYWKVEHRICPIMSRPVYNGKFLELYVVHCYGAQCKLYSTCGKSTGPVAIKNVTPVPGL